MHSTASTGIIESLQPMKCSSTWRAFVIDNDAIRMVDYPTAVNAAVKDLEVTLWDTTS